MGANPLHKDVYIELGAMWAEPGTTYGSGVTQVVDAIGHNHLPRTAVVKKLGEVFRNAPVSNPDGIPGINLHVDAGPNYVAGEAQDFVIAPGLARGGELIKETACVPDHDGNPQTPEIHCQFPECRGR